MFVTPARVLAQRQTRVNPQEAPLFAIASSPPTRSLPPMAALLAAVLKFLALCLWVGWMRCKGKDKWLKLLRSQQTRISSSSSSSLRCTPELKREEFFYLRRCACPELCFLLPVGEGGKQGGVGALERLSTRELENRHQHSSSAVLWSTERLILNENKGR